MNDSAHRNVPVGTILDYEGTPRTILRDYDTVIFPSVPIPVSELPMLRLILGTAETDALACRAEMAAAAAPEGGVTDGE